MVDEALILRKLADLDQYYSQLNEYENTTADQIQMIGRFNASLNERCR
jgi:hypothetical protein